jgi:hypothetical protein
VAPPPFFAPGRRPAARKNILAAVAVFFFLLDYDLRTVYIAGHWPYKGAKAYEPVFLPGGARYLTFTKERLHEQCA